MKQKTTRNIKSWHHSPATSPTLHHVLQPRCLQVRILTKKFKICERNFTRYKTRTSFFEANWIHLGRRWNTWRHDLKNKMNNNNNSNSNNDNSNSNKNKATNNGLLRISKKRSISSTTLSASRESRKTRVVRRLSWVSRMRSPLTRYAIMSCLTGNKIGSNSSHVSRFQVLLYHPTRSFTDTKGKTSHVRVCACACVCVRVCVVMN